MNLFLFSSCLTASSSDVQVLGKSNKRIIKKEITFPQLAQGCSAIGCERQDQKCLRPFFTKLKLFSVFCTSEGRAEQMLIYQPDLISYQQLWAPAETIFFQRVCGLRLRDRKRYSTLQGANQGGSACDQDASSWMTWMWMGA